MRIALAAIIVICLGIFSWANWPTASLQSGVKADRILITKHSRCLLLMSGSQALKQYRIALGGNPVGPKERSGDQKTPEGTYQISERKRDSAFHRALRISYPDLHDIQRAQANGVSPGADIMIHGLKNGLGFIGKLHRSLDWTAGCVAVTNPEIEEILGAVSEGTPVEIRP